MSLLILVAAYLLGSIPFGFLLVLAVRKEDIRAQGSGNIGATNVLRSGAKGLGAVTFLLDAGKGYAAVALAEHWARTAGPAQGWNSVVLTNAAILAALFAIVGHIFPVWLGWKGGKGVATSFGAFLALSPWAALSALGLFAVVVLLFRYVSLASVLASVAVPFLTLLFPPRPHTVVFILAVFLCAVLVIGKHRGNITRLVQGTEFRFGKPGAA
jgi:acyl phosphate:glycerol-3-phosphate acyltransferase